jgi:hypothetical protein
MKKKAGIEIGKFPFALLLMSLVIIVFMTIPNIQDIRNDGNVSSFWSNYGYSASLSLNENKHINSTVNDLNRQLQCDVSGISNDPDCPAKKTNVVDFINTMLNGGYSALVTLFNSVGTFNIIMVNLMNYISIPQALQQLIISFIALSALLSFIYLIFNRGSLQ